VNNSKSIIKKKTDYFHDRLIINTDNLKINLEKSLRALKTDYIDYYFIHEPISQIENIDQILNEVYSLKNSGKIRSFGLAFNMTDVDMHLTYINKFDILQFNNSPGLSGYDDIVEKYRNKSCIFFSPLKGSAQYSPKEKLLTLHSDFPRSISLVSMFTRKHIEDNANLFRGS
jgi:aryl-alcohol dehydrogenase-like predicted oxidoreductase